MTLSQPSEHRGSIQGEKACVPTHVADASIEMFRQGKPEKDVAGADEYTDSHLLTNPKKIEKERNFRQNPDDQPTPYHSVPHSVCITNFRRLGNSMAC